MLEHRFTEMLAREHIEEMRAEVEKERWLRAQSAPRIPLQWRLAVSFATLLIAVGTFIQERYEPVSYAEPEADCSTC